MNEPPAPLGSPVWQRPNTSLSEQDKQDMYNYAWDFHSYSSINQALRNDQPLTGEYQALADRMGTLIDRSALPARAKLYRHVSDVPEIAQQIRAAHQNGTPWTEKGFMSTSLDPNVPQDFDIGEAEGAIDFNINIDAPKGAKALVFDGAVSDRPGATEQHEVLLQRGSQFRIDNVTTGQDGRTRVEMTLTGVQPHQSLSAPPEPTETPGSGIGATGRVDQALQSAQNAYQSAGVDASGIRAVPHDDERTLAHAARDSVLTGPMLSDDNRMTQWAHDFRGLQTGTHRDLSPDEARHSIMTHELGHVLARRMTEQGHSGLSDLAREKVTRRQLGWTGGDSSLLDKPEERWKIDPLRRPDGGSSTYSAESPYEWQAEALADGVHHGAGASDSGKKALDIARQHLPAEPDLGMEPALDSGTQDRFNGPMTPNTVPVVTDNGGPWTVVTRPNKFGPFQKTGFGGSWQEASDHARLYPEEHTPWVVGRDDTHVATHISPKGKETHVTIAPTKEERAAAKAEEQRVAATAKAMLERDPIGNGWLRRTVVQDAGAVLGMYDLTPEEAAKALARAGWDRSAIMRRHS